MRRVLLRENPLCRPCAANGFTVAAAEIDHIVPVSDSANPELLDRENWQPICRQCHEAKTATENRRVADGLHLLLHRHAPGSD